MDRCTPLRFGVGNHVADADIRAFPEPVRQTPIARLRDEHKARDVVWTGATRDIVIEMRFPGPRVIDVLALPDSTLAGLDEVRLDLFSDNDLQTEVYTTDMQALAEPPPIGEGGWRAGIDPFGVPLGDENPGTFIRWSPKPVIARSGQIVIRRSDLIDTAADISLRMIVLAERVQMANNFVYGSEIEFQTPPDLVQASSGSWHENVPQIDTRRLALSLPFMPDGDRRALVQMLRRLRGQPLIVSAHPGREGFMRDEYAMFAKVATAPTFTHRFEGYHATDLVLVES